MRVIGIGDNVVDEYVNKSIYYPGGNALNFSVFAKQLGYESAYLGIFGDDEAGKYVKSVAEKLEIDLSNSRVKNGENGHAYVELIDGDRNFIRSNRGGIARLNPLQIDQKDLAYIKEFKLILTGINSHLDSQLEKLKTINVPIAYDFSISEDINRIKNVAGYIDFAITSVGETNDEKLRDRINLFHNNGIKYVLATQGGLGATFSNDGKTYFKKSEYVDAVDTMGAGDAFLTRFLTNFISKKNLMDKESLINESLDKASKFASKTCLVDGSYGFGKKIK